MFGEPAIFIDCRDAALRFFALGTEAPIINLVNDKNRQNKISQMIPTGRIEDRENCIVVTLALTISGSLLGVYLMIQKSYTLVPPEKPTPPEIHSSVFLDVSINARPKGRIEIDLYANTPLTSENFRCLCTGEKGMGR